MSVLVLTVGVVVPVIISGVFGDVVRKNVIGYSLDDSLLTGVTFSPTVTFAEGISSVTGVTTVSGARVVVNIGVNGCCDGVTSVYKCLSVDTDVAEVTSSGVSVVSSLLMVGGASEDVPTVEVEVLDSSMKGVDIDVSVLLEYSVERVLKASDVDVPLVVPVSGILNDVSGISLKVVSVSEVAFTSLGVVDVASEGMLPVEIEMEDNIEVTSVGIVSVKPEEVISGRSVVTVSPIEVVNLEDKGVNSEADVMECVYVIDSDINGDVCEEDTKCVEISELILVLSVERVISVAGPVGIAIGHVAFAVTDVEGTSVLIGCGEGSKVVMDDRM
jgi:hypothetical protein